MKRRPKKPRQGATPPGPLAFKDVVINSHLPGVEPRMGQVMRCQCGSESFCVWRIINHNHPHFQCLRCGSTFCQGGDCANDGADDADQGGAEGGGG